MISEIVDHLKIFIEMLYGTAILKKFGFLVTILFIYSLQQEKFKESIP